MLKKISVYILIFIFTNFYTYPLNAKIVEDKIFIGTTFSLKGENLPQSTLYQNHYNKVIKQINSSDGIKIGTKKYQFEIIFYDNQSNIFRYNSLIKRLIQNDGIQFLIGSNEFEMSQETINLLDKTETVIINSYNAISDYKDLFEKLKTVNSKKIRDHLLNNQ